jgi:hypothetical protein
MSKPFFEPGTAGNEKLKAVIAEMLGGDEPKRKNEKITTAIKCTLPLRNVQRTENM